MPKIITQENLKERASDNDGEVSKSFILSNDIYFFKYL